MAVFSARVRDHDDGQGGVARAQARQGLDARFPAQLSVEDEDPNGALCQQVKCPARCVAAGRCGVDGSADQGGEPVRFQPVGHQEEGVQAVHR